MQSLSPLDGRYSASVDALRPFFSEEALIRARVEVEIRYFIALSKEKGVKEFPPVSKKQEQQLLSLIEAFTDKDAAAIRKIEATTRHDVKAVEYWLREKIGELGGLKKYLSFIHFGLTSEDVNNLAYGILIHIALKQVIIPALGEVTAGLLHMADEWKSLRLLSLTHGQAATPTTLGKEMKVFELRLQRQLKQVQALRMQGKFGGAVGNFSAHKAAYPNVTWEKFRDAFVKGLGLDPLEESTQINPHDDLAELSHLMSRINTILLDFCRDNWLYISRGVFKQKTVKGEVGSSAMPHKVNPIDFENAEGNLGVSSALFGHFAEKLPISRLQRDLSDSTVQRNIGVAFGHHLLAISSIRRGLERIAPDPSVIQSELDSHPQVIAEAIQTVLRKHGVEDAYEQMKTMTRGEKVTKKSLHEFIGGLKLPAAEKERLQKMLG